MQAESIERIECVGLPLDPERMIVIDLADDDALPPGTVVEELRRGYTWNGRVLRLAEVRANRHTAGEGISAGSEDQLYTSTTSHGLPTATSDNGDGDPTEMD
jgi:molecular chaperone GrpE